MSTWVRKAKATKPRRCWTCMRFIAVDDDMVLVNDATGLRGYHPACAIAAGYTLLGDVSSLAANDAASSAERRLDEAARLKRLAAPHDSAVEPERAATKASTVEAERAAVLASAENTERPMAQEPQEEPMSVQQYQPTTQKGRLLAVMKARAHSSRGWVQSTPLQLANEIFHRYPDAPTLTEHTVVNMLHAMREQGVVRFNVRRNATNGGSTPMTGVPTGIRLTESGQRASVAQFDTPEQEADTVTTPAEAPGFDVVPGQTTVDDALGESQTTLGDAETVDVPGVGEVLTTHGIEAAAQRADAAAQRVWPNGHDIDLTRQHEVIDLVKYPLLLNLYESEQRLADAERLLRDAGKPEIADLVAEEAAKVDPFQQEARALVKALLTSRGPVMAVR